MREQHIFAFSTNLEIIHWIQSTQIILYLCWPPFLSLFLVITKNYAYKLTN